MPVAEGLPLSARVVIIGGGLVGCSAAYYLANLGWRDILVVEQGPLFAPGGSTSHAPGMVFQNNVNRTTCHFAMQTVEAFRNLELDGERLWTPVGSLEVATTPERWDELKRKHGHATSWGLETHLISPDEIARMVPIMRTDHLYGAIHVPTDGTVRTTKACEALARMAESKGAAAFIGNTRVTGIEVRGGRVVAVLTDRGRVETENALCAAGIWGPVIGRMAGVPIPLQPMQHLYAITDPLPEFHGETAWQSTPLVRHQDRSMYFRQHHQGYLLGSYRHEPVAIAPETIRNEWDDGLMPSCASFRDDLFEPALGYARELYPPLAAAELVEKVNGMFSFTPDAHSLIGESLEVRGFWACEAVWITHGVGAARAVAEWMVEGAPTLDVREEDLNRFYPHALTRPYISARGIQNYREIYDIIHPAQPMTSPRKIRLTPFYEREVELGAFFIESAGWERPQWYEANNAELHAVDAPTREGWAARFWSPIQGAEHRVARERVVLFDATPFVKIEVSGPGALAYLQRITANQMDQPLGRVTYTAMLNWRGGIMADVTVTRFDENRFWVVTGGGVGMHDLAWMRRQLPTDGSVRLRDLSSAWCCLGVWGPRARDLVQPLTTEDISNAAFPYLTAKAITIGDVPCIAIRISYVGELGWEIYAPTEYGLRLWDTLWKAGQPLGVAPLGGGAFDSLRLEKGYRNWGIDMYSEHNPYEVGLGFAVRLNKGDFLGRDALLRIKETGIRRKLCCMTFDDARVAVMGKEPIFLDGHVAGFVTSANYGYTVKQSIAYGYLPVEHASEGTKVEIQYFGVRYPATVRKEPLYDPAMTRLKETAAEPTAATPLRQAEATRR